jgi:hypothetical protein
MREFAYTVPFFFENQTLTIGFCQIRAAHFLVVCSAIENPNEDKCEWDSKPDAKSNKPIFEKVCNN